MYEVSKAYLEQCKKPGNKTRLTGSIGDLSFDDSNVIENSLTITNQCSGDTAIKIGQVYVGELDITICGLDLDRYSVRGMVIQCSSGLLLSSGEYEDVPLGIYTVDSAEYSSKGIIITAYDNMAKFDETCSITTTTGNTYQLAKLACDTCGVELGTTQSEFQSFANGSETLALYSDYNDISTWRDFISWLATTCGCFCTISRDGKLLFKKYTQDVVDTLASSNRYEGATFSDYVTKYTGLTATNATDNSSVYYHLDTDDGLDYDMGMNPFVQYGTTATQELQRRSILTALTGINYVPFSAEVKSYPIYDLGDVLSLTGGRSDDDALYCITYFTWTYHGKMKIKGVGENPRLVSIKTTTQKEVSSALNAINKDSMHYYDFANAGEIVIGDGRTVEIINLDFTTSKDTHVDFHAELKMIVETTEDEDEDEWTERECIATVTYYIGDNVVAYQPLMQEVDGQKLRHLLYTWTASGNVISNFRATMNAEGGSIRIPIGDLRAYWAGEGLVGEIEDTNPHVYDEIPAIVFDFMATIIDEAKVEVQTPYTPSATETVQPIVFNLMNGYTDSAETMIGMVFKTYLNTDYYTSTVPSANNTWTADEDNQYIETADMQGIQSIYCTDGGALSYQVSFDGGETWCGYSSNNEWVEDLTMTYETLASLTASEYGVGTVRLKAIFDKGETLTGINVVGSELPHENDILKLTFGTTTIGYAWSVADVAGESYTGEVEESLSQDVTLTKMGTTYTINVGDYMTERVTTDRQISSATISLNFIPATLNLEFGEDVIGETWTVTDGANETYTGTVDDTKVAVAYLQQKSTTYTVTCGEYTEEVTTNDHYNGDEFSTYLGEFKYTIDVTNVSGSTYGFVQDGEYYVSQNHADNSYSMCAINIFTSKPATLTLECVQASEQNYDYGILSKLNTVLSFNNNSDSNAYANLYGLYGTRNITYSIPKGTCIIYAKYRKDSSASSGADTFKFKPTMEEV